ncbi:hypothetical protein ABZX65_07490 [Streptomyces sp. NPDC003300]|uniref:hypothetical protein n=1 Tax=unclassified Streptomyces TaxID=2593676 RepID=UPI0033AC7305
MTTPDDAHGMEDQNKNQDQDQGKGADHGEGRGRDLGFGSPDAADASGSDGASASGSGADRTSASGSDSASGYGSGADGLFGLDGGFDFASLELDLDSADGVEHTPEEAALRALLHNAVQGIEASPEALDHLRRAVPARRQHRRQALAGAAAAVVLAGMAVPALIHAADTSSSTNALPANVSSTHASAPGQDGHTNYWAGGPSSGQAATGTGGAGTSTKSPTDDPPPATTTPSDSAAVSAPDCSSVQLGQGTSSADSPDSSGRVYGWFRVANVSGVPCTVPGSGQVQVLAEGSADPSRIQVVGHTPGDPASRLPSGVDGPVVLAPGDTYEVQFAWIPAGNGTGGCPTTPTTPPTTPTPTPTSSDPASTGGPTGSDPGTGTGSGSGSNGASTQLGSGDPPTSPPPGSVALNHTPAAGAPVVDGPVIQNACAGTLYTTAALPGTTSGNTTPGTGTSGGTGTDSGATGSGS